MSGTAFDVRVQERDPRVEIASWSSVTQAAKRAVDFRRDDCRTREDRGPTASPPDPGSRTRTLWKWAGQVIHVAEPVNTPSPSPHSWTVSPKSRVDEMSREGDVVMLPQLGVAERS